MSVFDVRSAKQYPITVIKFADAFDSDYNQAFTVCRLDNSNCIKIEDDLEEFVIITSKEHAENLKKALDKAIELGWLK